MSNKYEIGIVGLGTMGSNLLLNIADHGYRVIGLDKDKDKVEALRAMATKNSNIEATNNLEEFLKNIHQPRAILLLVPSPVVDAVIAEMSSLMSPGDMLIDAGNSHFKDTNHREKSLKEKGIYFFGMGISGGEEGARFGPSIMPGGNPEAYEHIRPILEAIAAKVNGEVCVSYLGPGSAGHYVKMVHNGIEYGLMQLMAETYHLMKKVLKLSNDECHEVYKEWNKKEFNSYLLEITEKIFLEKDDKTNNRLIDVILDVAKQKGTGMWVCQDAMELQVPIPTIDAAVSMRDLSLHKEERKMAGLYLHGPEIKFKGDRKLFLQQLGNAYYASSIITFAQGMALLTKASVTYSYDFKVEDIARIWRGGCIIRAALLEAIMSAFHSTQLSHLLLDSHLHLEVRNKQADLRAIVEAGSRFGIPLPAFMASLSYYDGYRSEWLPANLIQAQRDYFGAHTYERIDEVGVFHKNWGQE
ncbi:MAG: NADP-dependent phosphogluconate dehydrogenase [Bacteriovorax sp.]|nr:NADP-dependent phosphogluconate dehydrogenase [Bacteriovorax sp.]